ncbi:MAG: RNA polymerase sigma factor [bacterium]|nr:RNA polymerase sigma factor [bacterium]
MKENAPDYTDDAIVRGIQSQNADVFTYLYERYKGPLTRLFCSRSECSIYQAEVLVQETFLKVWSDGHTFAREGKATQYNAWIYQIANYRMIDNLRGESRRHRRFEGEDVLAQLSGEDLYLEIDERVANQQMLEEVRQAIGDLSTDQRTVIEQRFFEERSVKEIAVSLQRTESAVKAIQHRGVTALSRRLTLE